MIEPLDRLRTFGNIVEDPNVEASLEQLRAKVNELVTILNGILSTPFFDGLEDDIKRRLSSIDTTP